MVPAGGEEESAVTAPEADLDLDGDDPFSDGGDTERRLRSSCAGGAMLAKANAKSTLGRGAAYGGVAPSVCVDGLIGCVVRVPSGSICGIVKQVLVQTLKLHPSNCPDTRYTPVTMSNCQYAFRKH